MDVNRSTLMIWTMLAAPLLAVGCAGDRSATNPSAAAMAGTAEAVTSADTKRVCPVSGEPLGSMGPPVPVVVDGKTVYVCCEGCAEPLRRKASAGRRTVTPDDDSRPAGESIPFGFADQSVGYDGHAHVHR